MPTVPTILGFSSRTSWHRQENRLTGILESCRSSDRVVHDLTVSNPTECGFTYSEEILSALSDPSSLSYKPDARGLLSAREAIIDYYSGKNICVEPSHIFLTAGTSEAYSFVFKILCNTGDDVLVPRPSYPLFDYLAQANDVRIEPYHVNYDQGWHIDTESIARGVTSTTRAIVIVTPHNPTGSYLKKDEFSRILDIARRNRLALIVDEVFIDYPLRDNVSTNALGDEIDVLTFRLNGVSKSLGLPQMKLGWIAVQGPRADVDEALQRLEVLSDTYLSVNTPVQVALPKLFNLGSSIRGQILKRARANYEFLGEATHNSACTRLDAEGGWNAILRVPNLQSDEEWAIELLRDLGIYLYPGYFFDFESEAHLIVNLMSRSETFVPSITAVIRHVSER